MKVGQRVLVTHLGPHRGKTGTIAGKSGSFWRPVLKGKCRVAMDDGETIYTSALRKLSRNDASTSQ